MGERIPTHSSLSTLTQNGTYPPTPPCVLLEQNDPRTQYGKSAADLICSASYLLLLPNANTLQYKPFHSSSNPTRGTLIAIRGIERKASLGERVLLASLLLSLLNIMFRALLGFLFARVMRRPTGTRVFELGRGGARGLC